MDDSITTFHVPGGELTLDRIQRDFSGLIVKAHVVNGDWDLEIANGELLAKCTGTDVVMSRQKWPPNHDRGIWGERTWMPLE